MADLTREELHRLARLGAKARLEELRREVAAIRKTFRDLHGRRRQAAGGGSATGPTRTPMSDAARRKVSRRMKRYWAAKRKAKK